MRIAEYIAGHQMRRVAMVPPSLAQKFDLADDVEYYSSVDEARWAGICRKRNFFALYKPQVGITTGKLDESYPTLRSF
jgi:hypothetical protein